MMYIPIWLFIVCLLLASSFGVVCMALFAGSKCGNPEYLEPEVDRLKTNICDGCHLPYKIKDQETMTERCDACQVMKNLDELVKRI